MPVRKVCQSFFNNALSPFHQYRKNALIDATAALINGASLTLSSIGRYMPGRCQVKNKIKRADRLLGNQSLQHDIPLIFARIIAMLTRHLSLCVIAVDWSGYPTKEWHLLRASLLCDGRSIPLLSKVVPCELQQNAQVQKAFLDELAGAVNPEARVIIITDAGFHSEWFRHIKSLGWNFIGRIRGPVRFQLHEGREHWHNIAEIKAGNDPEIRVSNRPAGLGAGSLGRKPYSRCDGHFYLHQKEPKNRKHRCSRGRQAPPPKISDDNSRAAKEPWLLFSNMDDFKPREIMKLYSRRMQIEQNFRDEKSERYGFGLRSSFSRSGSRIQVLSLLATLSTVVLWLAGYEAERRGLHLRYQANSIKSRRVISYLTLAKNILRHSPLIFERIVLDKVLKHFAWSYQNMVLVY